MLDGPSRAGPLRALDAVLRVQGTPGALTGTPGVLDAGADHSNQKTSRMRRGTTDGWYTSRYLQAGESRRDVAGCDAIYSEYRRDVGGLRCYL